VSSSNLESRKGGKLGNSRQGADRPRGLPTVSPRGGRPEQLLQVTLSSRPRWGKRRSLWPAEHEGFLVLCRLVCGNNVLKQQ
jgi:hypothetical protein